MILSSSVFCAKYTNGIKETTMKSNEKFLKRNLLEYKFKYIVLIVKEYAVFPDNTRIVRVLLLKISLA